MKAISTQPFPRPTTWLVCIGVTRRSTTPALKVPGHLSWALALVERLLRRILSPGMHFETMILARAARTWIQRLQILQAGRGRERLITTLPIKERNVFHSIEFKEWLHANPHKVCPEQTDGKLLRCVVPPISLPNVANRSTISGEYLKATRNIEIAETITRRNALRATQALSSRPVKFVPAERRSPLWSNELLHLYATSSTPSRVVQQHRRVEDRTIALDSSSSKKIAPTRFFEAPVLIERPRSRTSGDSDLMPGVDRREPVTQPGPAVNVTQITDAVLKQLDRRLVAARERMGRI
jgi:hypothetical protein